MIDLSYMTAVMDLLDITDVQVYFDKRKMPYPYYYEIESIASVFPKEKMIFLDYILLDDYMEFYKLFTMCAYEVKAYRLNISAVDASTYCNAFVFHMLNVVFDYRMDIDIDDSFMKKLIEITELYPAEKIRRILDDYEFGMEDDETELEEECLLH